MRKFLVEYSSAGPSLLFNGIVIRVWLGTSCNSIADDLAERLNASLEQNVEPITKSVFEK